MEGLERGDHIGDLPRPLTLTSSNSSDPPAKGIDSSDLDHLPPHSPSHRIGWKPDFNKPLTPRQIAARKNRKEKLKEKEMEKEKRKREDEDEDVQKDPIRKKIADNRPRFKGRFVETENKVRAS
jgi:hypothetical protein